MTCISIPGTSSKDIPAWRMEIFIVIRPKNNALPICSITKTASEWELWPLEGSTGQGNISFLAVEKALASLIGSNQTFTSYIVGASLSEPVKMDWAQNRGRIQWMLILPNPSHSWAQFVLLPVPVAFLSHPLPFTPFMMLAGAGVCPSSAVCHHTEPTVHHFPMVLANTL